MMTKFGLKQKTLLLFFIICILSFLIIWLPFRKHLWNYKFNDIQKNYLEQLGHLDFAITNHFKNVENILKLLVNNDIVRSRNDSKFTNFLNADEKTFKYNYTENELKIINLFKAFKDNFPYINSIYMGRENGAFVRSHPRNKPTKYDPRERPWYKISKLNPTAILRTPPYTSLTTKDINIGTVCALTDTQGFYGVIGIDVTIENLTNYIQNIRIGNAGFILLIDDNDYILSISDSYSQLLMQKIEDNILPDFNKIFKSESGNFTTLLNKNEYYIFYTTSKLNWRLCAALPTAEINAKINDFLLKVMIIFFSALIITAILGMLLFEKIIIKPILQLKNLAIEIKDKKEFSIIKNTRENLNFKDELKHLADAFIEMLESIKASNIKLIESERKYRGIFENAVEGLFVANKDGEIIDCNNAFLEILGIAHSDFKLSEKNHDKEYPTAKLNITEYFSNKNLWYDIITRDFNENLAKPIETEIIQKSGEKRFARIKLSQSNSSAQSSFLEGIIIDITDKKLIEKELSDQKQNIENRYRQLTEIMSEAFAITELDFTIVYANTKFYKLFEYSDYNSKFSLKKHICNTENFEKFEKILKTSIEGINNNNSFNYELEWQTKNNKKIQTILSISKFFDSIQARYFYAVVLTDISLLKQIENELRLAKISADDANRAKSEFLANMSHEIRTPMNSILGLTHLSLKNSDIPEQVRDYLMKIHKAALTLLRIINDILDLSKIEAGKLTLENIDFNIETILENISNITEIKTREKNIELLIRIAPDIPLKLIGDPLRLEQVLLNLTNNAVKFTDNGEIIISITEDKRISSDKIRLLFSVADTGIGMTAEQLGRIFQPFSQAETSTTRTFGGTGLGLTICKKIVELMNGKIWVESKINKGSIFYFTAEFNIADEKSAIFDDTLISKLRGLKALIIDDNEQSRLIIKELLEQFYFSTVLAASGAEGLAEFEKPNNKFDIVFIDWKMPELDGLTTAKIIKEKQTNENKPAIVIMTAYGKEEIIEETQKLNLDGILIKPINRSAMFDTILNIRRDKLTNEKIPIKSKEPKTDKKSTQILEVKKTKNILLVEDNEINTFIVLELLKNTAFSVDTAENGIIGLSKVYSQKYDCILLDINMPLLDGYETAKKIRIEGKNINTPIIALTANALESEKQKCLECGMNDFLSKPFNPEHLIEILNKYCGA